MYRKANLGICMVALASALVAQTDNSKTNKKNGSPMSKTADDQKNNKADIQISADIRKAVMADSSLSTYAHNVKIVTRHGAVMLKGPVRTADEKSTIEAKAKEVAGADKVTSQISVAPEKKKKT